MTRLVVHSRVDSDGILRLAVPVGAMAADQEMQVTIESTTPQLQIDPDYAAWLDSIAGCWQGEFDHMPTGEFESRDAL